MPYLSKAINWYPPSLPSMAVITPPPTLVDVCGAMIVLTAVVEDAGAHNYQWEQISGPTVSFVISNNGLTLTFLREITTEDYIFRMYADRYLSIEVFEDFTVTDVIQSNPEFILDNTRQIRPHQTLATSKRLRLGAAATIIQGGDQPAALWWRFDPDRLRSEQTSIHRSNETFIQFNLIQEGVGVIGVFYGEEVLHRASPTVGEYYYVEAVYEYHTVVSNRARLPVARNVNPLLGCHAYTRMQIHVSSAAPVKLNPVVVRAVKGSAKKLLTSDPDFRFAPMPIRAPLYSVVKFKTIIKDSVDLTTVGEVEDNAIPIRYTKYAVVRINGGNIGQ